MRCSSALLTTIAALGVACGTDGLVSDPDLEPPAGTDAYDPSDGQGEGGGYYTTTGQVSGGEPSDPTAAEGESSGASSGAVFDCEPAQRSCPHLFELADDGYDSIEVMGSFADDGWDVGVPMSLRGGTWSAAVDLHWAADTEYRFRIDGGDTWIFDPGNPDTENDNSVVRALMCDDYGCR